MSAKTWSRVPTVLFAVVLVVSLGVGVWRDQNGPQWLRAAEMMRILPAEIVRVSYMDFSGTYSSVRDQQFEGYPSGGFYGQDLDDMQSFARCYYSDNSDDPLKTLTLYGGEFDATSMVRAIERDEGGFGSASRYGGVMVWTCTQGDTSISIALIDRFMVAGTTDRVLQCVEVAQGRRKSLSDNVDAKDVVRRLPEDYGFTLAVGTLARQYQSGCLAWGTAFGPALELTEGHPSAAVEKYGDVYSATARVAALEAERARQSDPAGFKISRDGVFVTSAGSAV